MWVCRQDGKREASQSMRNAISHCTEQVLSNVCSQLLPWRNRRLPSRAERALNLYLLLLSPWIADFLLGEMVTTRKTVQYIYLNIYIHSCFKLPRNNSFPCWASCMAEQFVCSNIFQSTFPSWFGKNFSFYNWISSNNNLDGLLTSGHGCMTLEDSFHLSLYK